MGSTHNITKRLKADTELRLSDAALAKTTGKIAEEATPAIAALVVAWLSGGSATGTGSVIAARVAEWVKGYVGSAATVVTTQALKTRHGLIGTVDELLRDVPVIGALHHQLVEYSHQGDDMVAELLQQAKVDELVGYAGPVITAVASGDVSGIVTSEKFISILKDGLPEGAGGIVDYAMRKVVSFLANQQKLLQ
jgi:hypothetical protein